MYNTVYTIFVRKKVIYEHAIEMFARLGTSQEKGLLVEQSFSCFGNGPSRKQSANLSEEKVNENYQ
jgi:hypothetical protein